MHLQRDSAVGVRFLAAVKEGRGLETVRRAAGVGKETGYRWLRESFLLLRERGLGVEAAQVELGYFSPLVARWDRRYPRGADRRHHLRVDAQVEEEFWRRLLARASLEVARRGAEVGRSTAYRWWQARYVSLREQGASVRVAARQLRVPPERATAWEAERAALVSGPAATVKQPSGARCVTPPDTPRNSCALARPARTYGCATRATGS